LFAVQEISSLVAQFECNADREISQPLKTTLGQLTSTARLAAGVLVEEAITQVMADAADLVSFTLQQGLFPIALAGDHSTAAATIAGIRRAHPSDRLGGLWADEAEAILRRLLDDPRVCCWEICEINPHLDTLNTLAEVSLRLFKSGLEQLAERLTAPGVGHAG